MTVYHCDEYETLSRRALFNGGLAAALRGAAGLPAWMPEIVLADPHTGPRGDTLVCIFLRGGADGLNLLVPHADEGYYRLRPTLNIPRPDDLSAASKTLDLDGFFGLHPALAPLLPLYQAGHLAGVHATGSPDESRSHFQAMRLMERASFNGGAHSGWLARHLASLDTGSTSALRAVAIGDMLPASLSGAAATALTSIDEYKLNANDEAAALLKSLFQGGTDPLAEAARQTFSTLEALKQQMLPSNTASADAGGYPETDFGQALRSVAQLIKLDVGVEVACIDFGNWDTHAAQGGAEGGMATLLEQLGTGLAAFYEELQERMEDISVVVMSEFGRRVTENAAFGTDHGHGGAMLLLGGGLNGGRIYGAWPGLARDLLLGPGDLPITTDYRHVLGEITRKRLNNPQAGEVFPGFIVEELGLAQARL